MPCPFLFLSQYSLENSDQTMNNRYICLLEEGTMLCFLLFLPWQLWEFYQSLMNPSLSSERVYNDPGVVVGNSKPMTPQVYIGLFSSKMHRLITLSLSFLRFVRRFSVHWPASWGLQALYPHQLGISLTRRTWGHWQTWKSHCEHFFSTLFIKMLIRPASEPIPNAPWLNRSLK